MRTRIHSRAGDLFVSTVLVTASGASHARGGCYGNCSGNGIAVLALLPPLVAYWILWRKSSGGPSVGQCLAYAAVAAVIGLLAGVLITDWAGQQQWLRWLAVEATATCAFVVLIHPRRFRDKSPR